MESDEAHTSKSSTKFPNPMSSDMASLDFPNNKLSMHNFAQPGSLHSYSSLSIMNTDLAISQSLTNASIPLRTTVECSDNNTNGKLVIGLSEKEYGEAHNAEEVPVLLYAGYTASGNPRPVSMADDDAAPKKKKEEREAVPSTLELSLQDTSSANGTGAKEPFSGSNLTSKLSTERDSTENKFYTFVILHAKEDEEIASRVRDKLQSLGIADGTTFCDGFEHPGCSTLDCLQNAVNNSAFTVLLLTPRWKSRWTVFKTNVALMNAIEQMHKYNTVIPFLPLGDRLPKNEHPLTLKVLKALDEKSSRFESNVNNVFKPEVIKEQKAIWQMQEDILSLERKAAELEIARDQDMRMKGAVMDLMTTQQKGLVPQPMISV